MRECGTEGEVVGELGWRREREGVACVLVKVERSLGSGKESG